MSESENKIKWLTQALNVASNDSTNRNIAVTCKNFVDGYSNTNGIEIPDDVLKSFGINCAVVTKKEHRRLSDSELEGILNEVLKRRGLLY